MKYAVQYAYDSFIGTKIITDTAPIEREEAIKLFNSHLDDFAHRLKEEQRPQLYLWEDVGDGEYPIYGKALVDLDYRDDLEYRNGKFYKTTKSEVELPE